MKNVINVQNRVLDMGLGTLKTDCFSAMYPWLNENIIQMPIRSSRAGDMHEVLDFKTHITNPYRRCVGGYGRNINIFFLIAEAVWIFSGRKDVNFLTMFNARMSDFSDDGKVFHAPYGHRMRHWGIRAEDKYVEENVHASHGYDQTVDALRLLQENPETRQVVLQIWNPEFDLGMKSKDLPCNDMVMLKIRDGKLIATVQNRSNDLHWGLPTNIFQFSFLTECLAACLGISLGTQTHNSHSLHIYTWNDVAHIMSDRLNGPSEELDLYDVSEARPMDFNFVSSVAVNRLREIDIYFSHFIRNLTNIHNGVAVNRDEIDAMKEFSGWLYRAYELCSMYLEYKRDIKAVPADEKDELRMSYINRVGMSYINRVGIMCGEKKGWDIEVLAKNFYAARLTNGIDHRYLGKL